MNDWNKSEWFQTWLTLARRDYHGGNITHQWVLLYDNNNNHYWCYCPVHS